MGRRLRSWFSCIGLVLAFNVAGALLVLTLSATLSLPRIVLGTLCGAAVWWYARRALHRGAEPLDVLQNGLIGLALVSIVVVVHACNDPPPPDRLTRVLAALGAMTAFLAIPFGLAFVGVDGARSAAARVEHDALRQRRRAAWELQSELDGWMFQRPEPSGGLATGAAADTAGMGGGAPATGEAPALDDGSSPNRPSATERTSPAHSPEEVRAAYGVLTAVALKHLIPQAPTVLLQATLFVDTLAPTASEGVGDEGAPEFSSLAANASDWVGHARAEVAASASTWTLEDGIGCLTIKCPQSDGRVVRLVLVQGEADYGREQAANSDPARWLERLFVQHPDGGGVLWGLGPVRLVDGDRATVHWSWTANPRFGRGGIVEVVRQNGHWEAGELIESFVA